MCIDAPETEGANRGAARDAVTPALPGHLLGQDAEGAVVEIHPWLRGAEISCGWQGFLLHGQQHLGQGRRACCCKEMADIGLDGADDTGSAGWTHIAPEFPEAGNLSGVSHRGASGMAFDQVHVLRFPSGPGICGSHGPELTLGQGCQEAATHVVGQADTPDDAIDPVAMGQGVLGPFEQEDAGPFADHQAVTGGVERGTDAAS